MDKHRQNLKRFVSTALKKDSTIFLAIVILATCSALAGKCVSGAVSRKNYYPGHTLGKKKRSAVNAMNDSVLNAQIDDYYNSRMDYWDFLDSCDVYYVPNGVMQRVERQKLKSKEHKIEQRYRELAKSQKQR